MGQQHRKFANLGHPADLFVGTFITGLGRGSRTCTPPSYLLNDLKGLLKHDPTRCSLREFAVYKLAPT